MSEKGDARRKLGDKPLQVWLPAWLHAAWMTWLKANEMTAREAMVYMVKRVTGAKEPENAIRQEETEHKSS